MQYQYLLTEDEMKGLAGKHKQQVDAYLAAVKAYYERKNEHLITCCTKAGCLDVRRLDEHPLEHAIRTHQREWTEQEPKLEDYLTP